jgi:hypothetical protein
MLERMNGGGEQNVREHKVETEIEKKVTVKKTGAGKGHHTSIYRYLQGGQSYVERRQS